MSEKSLMKAVLLCVGICGFVMFSFGIVLLVLRYQIIHLTVGLIVFGIAQLVFLCYPNPEKRSFHHYIILNLMMAFLMTSGLAALLNDDAFYRMAGIACFSLGLLLSAANNVFLMIVATSPKISAPKIEEAMVKDIKEKIMEDMKKDAQQDNAKIEQKLRIY